MVSEAKDIGEEFRREERRDWEIKQEVSRRGQMTSLVSLPFRVRGTVCKLLRACFTLRKRRREVREKREKGERVNFSIPDEFLGLFELVKGGLVEISIKAVETVQRSV